MASMSICLWFDTQAEEAVDFYTAVFKNSKRHQSVRYGPSGAKASGQKEGSVMTVACEIEGLPILALNGGNMFTFNNAISLVATCKTQAELDDIWNKLLEGGGQVEECGWLKDKFGVSWQIVPSIVDEMTRSGDAAAVERFMAAMMTMKKLDAATLEKAFKG